MFHGAWRCPKAMASSSTREKAPPPGTRMIWVSGDTGLGAVLDEHVEGLVGQLVVEVGRPVVLVALLVGRVEELLHRDVGHLAEHVDAEERELAQRRVGGGAVGGRSGVAAHDAAHRLAPHRLGHEVLRRRGDEGQAAAHLVGRRRP